MKSKSLIEQVKPDVLAWMESVRYADEGWGRWKYHAAMERPWALQASGIAVSLLHEFDELQHVSPRLTEEAITFLRSCQDPDDLLFKDPLETEDCHEGPHSWQDIWGQRNGSALQALALLGGEPIYGWPKKQFVDLRTKDGVMWMRTLDWKNPWRHGESWSRAIRAYLQTLPLDQRNDRDPTLSAMFEEMEAVLLDETTGYPIGGGCEDMPVAMAGLFKVMVAYLDVGRPVPNAGAAVDSTLALQHENGEFGHRRNMCMNWDSLWVLYYLDQQLGGDYRHGDIVEAGNRTADMLMREYRKDDGAFAFHGDHCISNHHSIRLNREALPISDMLGTTMCLKCLRYADEWNASE